MTLLFLNIVVILVDFINDLVVYGLFWSNVKGLEKWFLGENNGIGEMLEILIRMCKGKLEDGNVIVGLW